MAGTEEKNTMTALETLVDSLTHDKETNDTKTCDSDLQPEEPALEDNLKSISTDTPSVQSDLGQKMRLESDNAAGLEDDLDEIDYSSEVEVKVTSNKSFLKMQNENVSKMQSTRKPILPESSDKDREAEEMDHSSDWLEIKEEFPLNDIETDMLEDGGVSSRLSIEEDHSQNAAEFIGFDAKENEELGDGDVIFTLGASSQFIPANTAKTGSSERIYKFTANNTIDPSPTLQNTSTVTQRVSNLNNIPIFNLKQLRKSVTVSKVSHLNEDGYNLTSFCSDSRRMESLSEPSNKTVLGYRPIYPKPEGAPPVATQVNSKFLNRRIGTIIYPSFTKSNPVSFLQNLALTTLSKPSPSRQSIHCPLCGRLITQRRSLKQHLMSTTHKLSFSEADSVIKEQRQHLTDTADRKNYPPPQNET